MQFFLKRDKIPSITKRCINLLAFLCVHFTPFDDSDDFEIIKTQLSIYNCVLILSIYLVNLLTI